MDLKETSNQSKIFVRGLNLCKHFPSRAWPPCENCCLYDGRIPKQPHMIYCKSPLFDYEELKEEESELAPWRPKEKVLLP